MILTGIALGETVIKLRLICLTIERQSKIPHWIKFSILCIELHTFVVPRLGWFWFFIVHHIPQAEKVDKHQPRAFKYDFMYAGLKVTADNMKRTSDENEATWVGKRNRYVRLKSGSLHRAHSQYVDSNDRSYTRLCWMYYRISITYTRTTWYMMQRYHRQHSAVSNRRPSHHLCDTGLPTSCGSLA